MWKWGTRDAEPVDPPQSSTKTPGRLAKKPAEQPGGHPGTGPVRQNVSNVGLYKATLYSNIGSFFFGIAVGWSGTAERCVMERHAYGFQPTPLQWNGVCILLTLGAALWCLPMGMMVRFCGCRRTILIQLLPNVLGWLLTVFAQSVPMLCAGRFFLGMCGGAHCVVVPIYNAEISTTKKRGAMGVIFEGACICGVIYSFAMSLFLELRIINFVNLGLLALGPLQILMPESPAYYVDHDNIPRAEDSLRFLRGQQYDTRREIDHLTRDPTDSEREVRQGPLLGFTYKKVRRSLARSLAVSMLQKLCGALVFIFYGLNMLDCLKIAREFGLILCLGVVLGFLACFFLVDRLGRRPLLIFSSAGIVFVSIFLGLYFKVWMTMDLTAMSWIALFCIALFVGCYTAGVGSLTWVLTAELLVRPMRPLGCSIVCASNWLTAFFVICWFGSHDVKCQPYLFLLFAIIASLILLIALIYIPETKNLSSAKIQQRLGGFMNRPTVITFTSSSDSSNA
ncbi:glucose transporter type 3 [Drosophila teissieri]|uniref:glucose transporter type 3 n=1 Tax=Drosophila teissieri TaxID=7243 RepID=UPI001CB9DB97|nr:glucose transporter type 3 [Drosophila teissieri]